MTGRVVESQEMSERFLWDLRQTAQELVMENHVLHLKELGRRHGLGLSIEPYDMNPCADLMLGGAADVPMCEFWSQGYGFHTELQLLRGRLHRPHPRPARRRRRSRSPPGRRAPGGLSRRDEVAGRLGLLHGHQPARLPPLSAPTAARPLARHDDGAVRRSLGAHADVVGHGAAYHRYLARCQYMLRRGLPVADILLPGARRARRTYSARPRRPRAAIRPTGGATTSTAARPRRWIDTRRR